jgi:hypothetical protein
MSRVLLPFAILSLCCFPASSAFALDTGHPGGIGYTAHVANSLNRRLDTRESAVGFSRLNPGGRGNPAVTHASTNRGTTGEYSASSSVIVLSGGKASSTENNVPGRNDPPPYMGGRRARETLGGLGF